MKKNFLSLGLIAAAAFTLTNCTQELQNPVEPSVDGVPFEIVVSTADTKTANDGLKTVWTAGDALNVFHELGGGKQYKSDNKFEFSAGNCFKGTISEELVEEMCYNWYALYPYNEKVETPAATDKGWVVVGSKTTASQTQKGNNSMAHIAGENYPLAGVCKDWEYYEDETLEIEMSNLTSLVEVVVTNNTEEDLTVSSVAISAPENVVGTFYIDFTGEEVVYTPSGESYVSKKATLNVQDAAALTKGQSAKYYVAVKPFAAATGETLTLSVNGYEKKLTLKSEASFTAGKIKTITFAYDKVKVDVPSLTLPWYEDFESADLSRYVVVNSTTSTTETKLYEEDNLAGSKAPELLIAKGKGSFTATIATDGYAGDLTLIFKSNYPDRLAVSTTAGVTVTKVSAVEYTLKVAESVKEFDLTFTNTASSNARIDDISLVKGVLLAQELTFATPSYSFEYGSADASAFVGQTVQGVKTTVVYSSSNPSVAEVNAQTGAVTLKGVEGSAIITAIAAASAEYKEATAEYKIAVSLPSTGEEKTYTFEITTGDFNSTSYVANNIEHTSTAKAADGSTMEVKWTSYQVMYQNSVIQWQKNKGNIYNTTNLGTIKSVELEDVTGGTFTKNIGSELQPTSEGTGGYFNISVGAATGKLLKVVVTFTK